MDNSVTPFAVSAIGLMYVQHAMKSHDTYQKFVTAFPGADKWAHRFVAGAGSLIVAAGIHVTFTGSYDKGWTGNFSVPDIFSMGHAISDFLKVYILQQFAYDIAKEKLN